MKDLHHFKANAMHWRVLWLPPSVSFKLALLKLYCPDRLEDTFVRQVNVKLRIQRRMSKFANHPVSSCGLQSTSSAKRGLSTVPLKINLDKEPPRNATFGALHRY